MLVKTIIYCAKSVQCCHNCIVEVSTGAVRHSTVNKQDQIRVLKLKPRNLTKFVKFLVVSACLLVNSCQVWRALSKLVHLIMRAVFGSNPAPGARRFADLCAY